MTAELIAAIDATRAACRSRGDQVSPCDGPGESVIAAADLDAMADENEARETRWREGEQWTTS